MKQEPTATAIAIGYNDDKRNTGPIRISIAARAESGPRLLVTRHGIDPRASRSKAATGREPVGDQHHPAKAASAIAA